MGFYINDGMLFLSRAGELARLSACGKDSIRFQSSANCVIADQDFTLMPQKIDAQITVNDDSAIMKNGDMEAKLYPNGRVEFYFKGRLILREKSELTFDAQIRNYRNKDSMLWKARVTFDANENVILIAATNRPDVLDPALLRPGRFDRQVTVSNPDVKGREEILKVHTRKVPLAKDVNLSVVARGTPGFSGADLANLVNEAALLAARKNKLKVSSVDFDDAKDKVLMGNERKSMAMDEKEKRLTAYHEAGHAICSLNVKDTDPIHKATIIPRGRALGMVQQLPEKDKYSYTRVQMLSRLAILMGGRVAEELKFGYDNVTSGASSDINAATNLARAMVTEWGMSDALGPIRYSENSNEVFLGRSVTQNQNMSEETARLVDAEIKRLVNDGYEEAKRILKEHGDDWEKLAEALMEYETLTGEEIKDVLSGKVVDKSKDAPVSEEKRTKASIPEL